MISDEYRKRLCASGVREECGCLFPLVYRSSVVYFNELHHASRRSP